MLTSNNQGLLAITIGGTSLGSQGTRSIGLELSGNQTERAVNNGYFDYLAY